ncbi:hypothetical protein SRB5_03380 [Streptomyces sp. RB5]|uniref:Uncharacterized protein n=1 Tax=Streptomyces smaragdinus TaxID=2585196 RepID=A0A7K0C9V2_9ACTN|nr:hypothetical protein [Streptomyces smaragdinus]MQY10231.1 hypothetical protein [Streptomyces smaragdinus]
MVSGKTTFPTTEVGIPLGRDKNTGVEVFSPIENSNGIISPPGGGKTALMCGMILDAHGPVLDASSKLDLYERTAHLRAEAGRVLVFNPQGLGGDVPSTLAWDPVIGCRDPEVALRRTRFLLWGSPATKGLKEDDFWQSASCKVLKSFLWAADMEGLSLLDVAAWSKMPTKSPATRTS